MSDDKIFEIALAYFKQHDISDLTPEQALDKFNEILTAMRKHCAKDRSNKAATFYN